MPAVVATGAPDAVESHGIGAVFLIRGRTLGSTGTLHGRKLLSHTQRLPESSLMFLPPSKFLLRHKWN